MLHKLSSMFGGSPRRKTPLLSEPSSRPRSAMSDQPRQQTFTKVFRWRLPDGETEEPGSVEVAGSFTHWQKVSLHRDGLIDAWHVTVHHIPGNRTHHYVLLVDGTPVFDHACDGLAVPHGFQEEQFALPTDKGPRVLMLFAQTK
jgi:hypothetical protein